MGSLLYNVTKNYAELSVGVNRMLIQRCNNDVGFIYNGIKTRNSRTQIISLNINKTRLYVDNTSELIGRLYTDRPI